MPELHNAILKILLFACNILAFAVSFDDGAKRLKLRENLIVVAFLNPFHLSARKTSLNVSQVYGIVNAIFRLNVS